ncbi:four helix bundle protein [Candidatus Saccharibacteria bacterium]|nr:four helix bundle protein [Candidatus Saccharibacteria bacterium]
MEKIQTFEQLIAWQKAQDLAVLSHNLTKKFPGDERFSLISQLRRASNSVSANIAEGFGRRTSKDKVQFYTIAYGSLLEVKNYLYLAEKLGYLTKKDMIESLNLVTDTQKLINALMRSIKQHAQTPN